MYDEFSEINGIGLRNESSLHAQIKNWYYKKGDFAELKVDNYIIDLVRNELLIEIQTQNFSSIKTKLKKLVKNNYVRLVYPLPVKTTIIKYNKKKKKVISTRKSPKKVYVEHIFKELMRIPHIIKNSNFEFEVLLIEIEELRCNDGKGSWRRQGQSIIDRKLVKVIKSVKLKKTMDYLQFIPNNLNTEFTNKELCEKLNISIYDTRKMTYTLKKIDVIKQVGKRSREYLYKTI